MIKFIHKKHIHKTTNGYKFVIYYDFAEVILGLLLIALVGFFIFNYLQNNFAYKSAQPYITAKDSNPLAVPKKSAATKK